MRDGVTQRYLDMGFWHARGGFLRLLRKPLIGFYVDKTRYVSGIGIVVQVFPNRFPFIRIGKAEAPEMDRKTGPENGTLECTYLNAAHRTYTTSARTVVQTVPHIAFEGGLERRRRGWPRAPRTHRSAGRRWEPGKSM